MKKCPLTYELSELRYSLEGLRSLSPKLTTLNDFPYGKSKQLELALELSDKISFSGVQPKIGAKLNLKNQSFEPAKKGSTYIFKLPHHLYDELPQNEDLTMKLARKAKIDVPPHGLVYAKDGSLLYFIKRFDRHGRKKFAVEDFGQLAGLSSDEKYDYTMEKVIVLIDKYCTFNLNEKAKLFRIILFSFLVGNEDLHIKNLSLITEDDVSKLTPAYDLVNSTLVTKSTEELALPLKGKKSNFKRDDFINYFGKEKLGLNEKIIEEILNELQECLPEWRKLILQSFLTDEKKEAYLSLVANRSNRLFTRL